MCPSFAVEEVFETQNCFYARVMCIRSALKRRKLTAYIVICTWVTVLVWHHGLWRTHTSALPTEKLVRGVVLTSFFTGKEDPQRHKRVNASLDYIGDFLTSLENVGLRAVIFHDESVNSIPDLKSSAVEFVKSTLPADFSINDFRFFSMYEWVSVSNFDFALVADVSDVVFFKSPFQYMAQRSLHGVQLFLSDDVGTITSNNYHRCVCKKCYDAFEPEDPNAPVYNAGLWGGSSTAVRTMLHCISNELKNATYGRGNCNMATFNTCVLRMKKLFGEQIFDSEADNVKLFNHFDRVHDCTSEHYVVHNKCAEWARYAKPSRPHADRMSC